MNPKIRLTSAKVGVEVEAELGNIGLGVENDSRVKDFQFEKVKLPLKYNLDTFPGCAAYADGCAAYADGCAAYADGCAAYADGCAAYAVGCAAYVRQCENKANSVQLSWSWD